MKRCIAALLLAFLAGTAAPQAATEILVSTSPLPSFRGVAVGGQVDKLIYRGGIALVSQNDDFGGLSGLTMTGPNQLATFVTDRGNFISGQLAYDDRGILLSFIGVQVEPMRNSKGDILPRQYARDAESVDTVYRDGLPVAVRVGFEHLTRVADFALTNGRPGGAAREVPVPDWLTDNRSNETLESVCIAPPASPVAGSTLLIAEEVTDEAGNHRGELLGNADKGPIGYSNTPVVNPTECAFLPNGDLLVLERGVSMLSFVMQLRRVPAAQVRPGNIMSGELLLSASGTAVDNMEAMTVHTAPDGEIRILIGSDDNFNGWQRTMLLEFALAE